MDLFEMGSNDKSALVAIFKESKSILIIATKNGSKPFVDYRTNVKKDLKAVDVCNTIFNAIK